LISFGQRLIQVMSIEENNHQKFIGIRAALSKLSAAQYEFLFNYLNAFYVKYSREGSIYLKMMECIKTNPKIDYLEFSSSVLDLQSEDAKRKNLERFRDKIYESLLLDVNLKRKDSIYTKLDIAIIESKKNLLKCRMAYLEALEDDLEYYLSKSVKIARHFELYDDVIEALQIQRNVTQVQGRVKEDKKIKEEIAHYRNCRELYSQSAELRNDVIKLKAFEGNRKPKIKNLYDQLNLLLVEALPLKSAVILRQLYYAKLNLDGFLEDWENAYNDCKVLEDLISNNESVYKPRELGTVKLNLAIFSMLTGQFAECERAVQSTLDYFPEGTAGYVSGMEIMFFAQYYQGKLDNALNTISWLLNNDKNPPSPLQEAKWNYYSAATLFLQGDFKSSLRKLDNVKEIEKDKEGWNLWIRMLRVLNYIESNSKDVADNETDNFRRYLSDYSLPERFKFSFRLIASLQSSGFDFSKAWQRNQAKVNKWRTENKHQFKVQTPELIIIDQWLEARASGKPFIQNF